MQMLKNSCQNSYTIVLTTQLYCVILTTGSQVAGQTSKPNGQVPKGKNTMSTLNINTISLVDARLDSTYFRTSDITPSVDGNTLTIIDGRGSSRSWGSPSVKSNVSRLADDVVKVEVTGWHKHTVGPVGGSFYFVNENGTWTRRTANHKRVKAVL